MSETNPDCYKCVHRRNVPGDCHSRCMSATARVTANQHGVKKGWFMWPINFDPAWKESCTGFEPIEKEKEGEQDK